MKTFKDFYKTEVLNESLKYDISTDELFTFVEVLADKAKLFNKSSIHALRNYAFWGKKIEFAIAFAPDDMDDIEKANDVCKRFKSHFIDAYDFSDLSNKMTIKQAGFEMKLVGKDSEVEYPEIGITFESTSFDPQSIRAFEKKTDILYNKKDIESLSDFENKASFDDDVDDLDESERPSPADIRDEIRDANQILFKVYDELNEAGFKKYYKLYTIITNLTDFMKSIPNDLYKDKK